MTAKSHLGLPGSIVVPVVLVELLNFIVDMEVSVEVSGGDVRGKSLSRWVRNRDSWRLPRQIAIFGICRDISRQYTFSAISRDFLWFSTSDCDFIYSLTVKFLVFLPSEADLTSRYKS